jgi:hypothetical protein
VAHKGLLPAQAIAERYDIVVDFAAGGMEPGDRLYLVNTMEHEDGRGPKRAIPLADVLSERYKPVASAAGWFGGDPGVGKILEFRVMPYAGSDRSMDPADYLPGKKAMIPLSIKGTVRGSPRRPVAPSSSVGAKAPTRRRGPSRPTAAPA